MTPGYGLFAFRSDFRMSDDAAVETKVLAFQNENSIQCIDSNGTSEPVLFFGDMDSPAKPAFFYTSIDGALRVCDGNYNNIGYLEDENNVVSDSLLNPESHVFVKYLKFISKTWFHEDVSYHAGTGYSLEANGFKTHDFAQANAGQGLDAFISYCKSCS